MKKYRITYGSGLAWIHEETVEVEDFECEQDALDKLIDDLERRGYMGCFASQEEIDRGDFHEDEYIRHGIMCPHCYGKNKEKLAEIN